MKTIKLSILFIFVLFTTNSCKEGTKQDVSPNANQTQIAIYTIGFQEFNKDQGVVVLSIMQTPDRKLVVENFAFRYSEKNIENIRKLCEGFNRKLIEKSPLLSSFKNMEDYIKQTFQSPTTFKNVTKLKNEDIYKLVNKQSFSLASLNTQTDSNDFLLSLLSSFIPSAMAQSNVQGTLITVYGVLVGVMAGSVATLAGLPMIPAIAFGAAVAVGFNLATGQPTTTYDIFPGVGSTMQTVSGIAFGAGEVANAFNKMLEPINRALGGPNYSPPNPLPETWEDLVDDFQKWLDDLWDFLDNPNNGNFGSPEGFSWGDPHLTTFDGLAYDFQAWGEFIAVKSTTDNFEVQVRQEGVGNGRISFNRGFAVQTGQDVVCWVEKKLYINNILTNINFTSLPLKEGASLGITKDKKNNNVLNIKSKYGDLVTVPVNSFDYTVKLSETRKGKIVGLLGDFDGKKENDLKMKNNEVITLETVKTSGISVKIPFNKLYPTFADNWRIEQKNSLFYYDSDKNTESFTKRNYPQGTIELTEEKRAWATGICKAAGIDKEPYLSACIIDVAQTDDPNMASASLWMQQNQLKSNTLQVATESDVNHFKNVKVTISESQGNLEDSCLVSFSTGQVFQLKDGAKYANLIDGLFLTYCGISLNTPQKIITCGFSCGVSRMNSVLVGQKWNKYRRGTIEFIGFASDDKPSDPNRVASSTWDFILTSNDIENSFKKHYGAFRTDDNFSSTNVIQTANNCVPSLFIDKTLRRFLTEDGKKGLIKLNSWGKGKSGWWIEFDIKIQK